ncbi:2-dehydro-3-deoxy-D-gluconate 5-dehydrogenase KduD [Paractinoplanes ferrugineus]|uniref:2-deoxy-D-gluconate 3-dehydrogenase n=1 Tax=Paractinoplanes ferrugineus TaxID=113564 RepID=A0A919MCQ1_9ACTN|nr:2-dehydro-3-deoxy-D-gluconate 5-dehydrogenase KduD [Actinoplanes ferrugineus]GIE10968.1 2-deoxy-D-gluconate 3-dehydrogenase [Actinoplanes ferrugineus]
MILDRFRLDGQVALVTGGNRGLGQGCAIALAEAGADVALLGRSSPADTMAAVAAVGRRALHVPGDLGKADLAGAVRTVLDELGRLDILVNNAGIIRRADAVETSAADWDEVLTVDLDAVWHLSQAAGRVMLDAPGGGRIINVASMLSFQGGIRVPAYTAAKHAVVGLTKALANEWAAHGVNVNAVAPGYMATDNTAALRADPARAAAILDRIPAGRWGTPADLAGAVVFLASDAARYLHGTVLPVDGGWLAR